MVMAEKLSRKETVTFEELLTSNVIEQEALINPSVLLLSRIARLRKFYEYRRWQSNVVFETDKRYSTLVFCIGAFCSALAV